MSTWQNLVSALALQTVRIGGPAIVSLSQYLLSHGVPVQTVVAGGDAVNNLGYGGTAPSGTDYTTQIQAAINALGPTGGMFLWDGAWGVSAPLLIPDNILVLAPTLACGAILRLNANCSMFQNAGSVQNDLSTNKQNSYGAINPVPGGDQRYRVLGPFASKNISFTGGTWNGNKANQNGGQFNNNNGPNCVFQFMGVDGFRIEGATVFGNTSFMLFYANCQNFIVRDNIWDHSPATVYITDCISGRGPSQGGFIYNNKCHTHDDAVALDANDVDNTTLRSYFSNNNITCGTNYPCAGDMTQFRIVNTTLFLGAENGTNPNTNCMRFMSTVSRIDDVVVDGVYGSTTSECFPISNYPGGTNLIPGNGNFGRLSFHNIDIDWSSPRSGDGFMFYLDAIIDDLTIDTWKVVTPPASLALVGIGNNSGNAVVRHLNIDVSSWAPSTNNAVEFMHLAGPVYHCLIKYSGRRATGTAASTPIVRTASGASILNLMEIDGLLDTSTVMFDHQAGTIESLILNGQFSNAGGGVKPLNLAAGQVIKNVLDLGLQYATRSGVASGLAALGGGASITNYNTFVD